MNIRVFSLFLLVISLLAPHATIISITLNSPSPTNSFLQNNMNTVVKRQYRQCYVNMTRPYEPSKVCSTRLSGWNKIYTNTSSSPTEIFIEADSDYGITESKNKPTYKIVREYGTVKACVVGGECASHRYPRALYQALSDNGTRGYIEATPGDLKIILNGCNKYPCSIEAFQKICASAGNKYACNSGGGGGGGSQQSKATVIVQVFVPGWLARSGSVYGDVAFRGWGDVCCEGLVV